MIEINTEWDKEQKRILLSRLDTVEKLTRFYIEPPHSMLPRQLSIRYVEMLRADIIRNARKYAPYHPDYAKWKKEHGKYQGFWRLMGDLFVNTRSFKLGDGWFGGIKFGLKDSGGKSWSGKGKSKSIVMYGKVMEYGMPNIRRSGKHPARPLFTPVFKEFVYSKSKTSRGSAWVLADKTLERIGDKWKGK